MYHHTQMLEIEAQDFEAQREGTAELQNDPRFFSENIIDKRRSALLASRAGPVAPSARMTRVLPFGSDLIGADMGCQKGGPRLDDPSFEVPRDDHIRSQKERRSGLDFRIPCRRLCVFDQFSSSSDRGAAFPTLKMPLLGRVGETWSDTRTV